MIWGGGLGCGGVLLLSLIGGLLFRIRGDRIVAETLGWKSATTVGRLLWAIPTGLLIGFLIEDWRIGAWSALAAYWGVVFGWGSYMDLGRMERKDNEWLGYLLRPIARFAEIVEGSFTYDLAGMTLMGLWATMWIALTVMIGSGGFGTTIGLLLVGSLWGLIDEIAWRMPSWFPMRGPPLGEFVFGYLIWFVLLVGL